MVVEHAPDRPRDATERPVRVDDDLAADPVALGRLEVVLLDDREERVLELVVDRRARAVDRDELAPARRRA
jgi:hypothetical protein